MIFLNGEEVKITGGDYKKNLIECRKVKRGSEFVVGKEQLTADGGHLEIYHAVNGAHNAVAMATGITKDEFDKFESVRASGLTIMWHVRMVQEKSGLSREKIEVIMAKYKELKTKYMTRGG